VSATSCKAAGYTLDGGEGVYTESNLVESWDGSNWTVDAGTGISSGQMSCSADPTFCMMRSYSSETWNGSVWSAVPSPAAAQYSGLSCPGPTFCATVGLYLSPQTGLVSGLWNGSTWSAAPVPSPDALSITTPSLPGGTVGLGYSVTLAASGGNPPYHWKVVTGSGALPRGLKLDKSTGVISGTPKSEGLSTFTIQVVDTATKPLKHALRVENLAQATFSIAIT
jgi:hypothetical protein